MVAKKRYRPDYDGNHQGEYQKNKKIILARGDTCALCGAPVDFSLRFPHPLSATVDHIIPVSKGGHPSALENLQLAHLICNQVKSSKAIQEKNRDSITKEDKAISNRILPQSLDWKAYRAE